MRHRGLGGAAERRGTSLGAGSGPGSAGTIGPDIRKRLPQILERGRDGTSRSGSWRRRGTRAKGASATKSSVAFWKRFAGSLSRHRRMTLLQPFQSRTIEGRSGAAVSAMNVTSCVLVFPEWPLPGAQLVQNDTEHQEYPYERQRF